MPQIDILTEVSSDKQIDISVVNYNRTRLQYWH